MTNRPDLLDEALTRPGRIELKIEIGLPDIGGRQQILQIHTSPLARNNFLEADVDLPELADRTKNFTGVPSASPRPPASCTVRCAVLMSMGRRVLCTCGRGAATQFLTCTPRYSSLSTALNVEVCASVRVESVPVCTGCGCRCGAAGAGAPRDQLGAR